MIATTTVLSNRSVLKHCQVVFALELHIELCTVEQWNSCGDFRMEERLQRFWKEMAAWIKM